MINSFTQQDVLESPDVRAARVRAWSLLLAILVVVSGSLVAFGLATTIPDTGAPVSDSEPDTTGQGPPAPVALTISSSLTSTEAAAMVASARAAGYGRLGSMQAAAQAWAVPVRPVPSGAVNAQDRGILGDGVTDNTAALQALLNSLPAGSTIYFPRGTYVITGPVSITRAVTIFGESGTVFNCQRATQHVFNINRAGSATSPMRDVTFTGIVIEGPGVETNPAMIYGRYLQNFHVSYVKIHNAGYAGVRVDTSTDVLIERSVFDNIFQTGLGYSVCICDHSDRVTIRNNFFLTKGRHYITTGTSNTNLPVADYPRSVLIENNYFEYSTRGAADTHYEAIGPYIVRNNVFYKCSRAVSLRGGYTEITDNVVLGENVGYCGFYVYESPTPPSFNTATNKILHNSVFDTRVGIALLCSNDLVQDNILSGHATNGLWIRSDYCVPDSIRVERNIFKGWAIPISIKVPHARITQTTNYFL